ncbi:MAG: hypothetical protein O3A46_15715 [Candidatus Poribacteria bacterium]|nr:hypothetical protein [Candidatus Poribacteria bacterium]
MKSWWIVLVVGLAAVVACGKDAPQSEEGDRLVVSVVESDNAPALPATPDSPIIEPSPTRYRIEAPPGYRVMFWGEVRRNGKLDPDASHVASSVMTDGVPFEVSLSNATQQTLETTWRWKYPWATKEVEVGRPQFSPGTYLLTVTAEGYRLNADGTSTRTTIHPMAHQIASGGWDGKAGEVRELAHSGGEIMASGSATEPQRQVRWLVRMDPAPTGMQRNATLSTLGELLPDSADSNAKLPFPFHAYTQADVPSLPE